MPNNQEETEKTLRALREIHEHYGNSGAEYSAGLLAEILGGQRRKEEEGSRDSRAELELEGQIEDKAEVLKRLEEDRLERLAKIEKLRKEHEQKE